MAWAAHAQAILASVEPEDLAPPGPAASWAARAAELHHEKQNEPPPGEADSGDGVSVSAWALRAAHMLEEDTDHDRDLAGEADVAAGVALV